MQGFSPGTSPPPVRIPIRISNSRKKLRAQISVFLSSIRNRQVYYPHSGFGLPDFTRKAHIPRRKLLPFVSLWIDLVPPSAVYSALLVIPYFQQRIVPMKSLACVRTKSFLEAIIISLSVCSTLYSSDSLSGKWRCEGKGWEGDDVYFVLDLKQSGDIVTGSITYGEGEAVFSISNGLIQGNKLEFAVVTEDSRYFSSVTVGKNRMDATWKDDNGHSGTWQGQREDTTGH
jgi:hypothetical protein